MTIGHLSLLCGVVLICVVYVWMFSCASFGKWSPSVIVWYGAWLLLVLLVSFVLCICVSVRYSSFGGRKWSALLKSVYRCGYLFMGV